LTTMLDVSASEVLPGTRRWVLRAAFGLLAAAGLLGVVLAIAAAVVQSAALLTAGAEWFGGAATAAAFLWGVYELWRAEQERTAELRRQAALAHGEAYRKATHVRIADPSAGGIPSRKVRQITFRVVNYSADPLLDVVGSLRAGVGSVSLREQVVLRNESTVFRFAGLDESWPEGADPPPLPPIEVEFSLPDGTRWRREFIDGDLSKPAMVVPV
jgi:hypothetical protein